MTEVLQEQVTLDQAVLSASTFTNGCDWAFYFMPDGVYMGYGCYGVHINLLTGKKKLLYQWFKEHTWTEGDITDEKVRLPISPETRLELLKREPCKLCGQPFFKVPHD